MGPECQTQVENDHLGEYARIADYLVICGLDVHSGLEPVNHASTKNHEFSQPLERSYQCKILCHYPDNVPWNPFDESAVRVLCMPRGMRFSTRQQVPRFHPFIITKEDGSHVYGAAAIFYEKVLDVQILRAVEALNQMHAQSCGRRDSALPENAAPKDLYASKSVCFLSQLPFVNVFRKVLEQLLALALNPDPTGSRLPLECYLYNVLYEVLVPPPSKSLRLIGPDSSIFCYRPGASELPLLDYPLVELFRVLGVIGVIDTLNCMLLERQILIYSHDYYRLMLVCQCLTSLMFPFTWRHVYVPILPPSLNEYLDVPVPFIMGLYHDAIRDVDLSSSGNVCIVNADSGKVEMPEDLAELPQKQTLVQLVSQTILSHHQNLPPVPSSGDLKLGSQAHAIEKLMESNQTLAKLHALVQKTGIIKSLSDLPISMDTGEFQHASQQGGAAGFHSPQRPLRQKKPYPRSDRMMYLLNASIRETFLNHFVYLFHSYDSFVIPSSADPDNSLGTTQNFDKTSFLAEQPRQNWAFLLSFLDSQMFASFVDAKILAHVDEDANVALFDRRIADFKANHADLKTLSVDTFLKYHEVAWKNVLSSVDIEAPVPHEVLPSTHRPPHSEPSHFPVLDHLILLQQPSVQKPFPQVTPRRRLEHVKQQSLHLQLDSLQREQQGIKTQGTPSPEGQKSHPKLRENPSQSTVMFIKQLLNEVKTKTKRILVEKMSKDSVDLGDSEIIGVEENTLVSSLCDLLERIWLHGWKIKTTTKSALWNHLLWFFGRRRNEGRSSSLPSPARMWKGTITPQSSPRREEPDRRSVYRMPAVSGQSASYELPPLLTDLYHTIINVHSLGDIKTEIGFSRAFVRLSLERGLLAEHLRELLSDEQLLNKLFHRYAFLRCHEERDQFLFHLQSLSVEKFNCFTCNLQMIEVPYRIVLVPSKKCPTTTANLYYAVAGKFGSTERVPFPKGGAYSTTLKYRNLGPLTVVRVGHDDGGSSPKLLLDAVLVRNEYTGRVFTFPCGRWLGRDVDDGSCERLMVAEPSLSPESIPVLRQQQESLSLPGSRSPSLRRSSAAAAAEAEAAITSAQEGLAHSVNRIVKFFGNKQEEHESSLMGLLCGEDGLVPALEPVFLHGFKGTARFFAKLSTRVFIWDFLQKVAQQTKKQELAQVLNRIGQVNRIGKDDKFQLWVCAALHRRKLHEWYDECSSVGAAKSMYEDGSFLRLPECSHFAIEILRTLADYSFPLDRSMQDDLKL